MLDSICSLVTRVGSTSASILWFRTPEHFDAGREGVEDVLGDRCGRHPTDGFPGRCQPPPDGPDTIFGVVGVVGVGGAVFDRHFIVGAWPLILVVNDDGDRCAQADAVLHARQNVAVSVSLRGVTISDCPGRLRSSSTCICSSETGMRGGQPSIVTPTAPPWDSPSVDAKMGAKVDDMAGV